jgi:hypothetical protein
MFKSILKHRDEIIVALASALIVWGFAGFARIAFAQ